MIEEQSLSAKFFTYDDLPTTLVCCQYYAHKYTNLLNFHISQLYTVLYVIDCNFNDKIVIGGGETSSEYCKWINSTAFFCTVFVFAHLLYRISFINISMIPFWTVDNLDLVVNCRLIHLQSCYLQPFIFSAGRWLFTHYKFYRHSNNFCLSELSSLKIEFSD